MAPNRNSSYYETNNGTTGARVYSANPFGANTPEPHYRNWCAADFEIGQRVDHTDNQKGKRFRHGIVQSYKGGKKLDKSIKTDCGFGDIDRSIYGGKLTIHRVYHISEPCYKETPNGPWIRDTESDRVQAWKELVYGNQINVEWGSEIGEVERKPQRTISRLFRR